MSVVCVIFDIVSQAAMCRSSQPLVGLRGRSAEDEQLIQCIVDANPDSGVMYMIDTRPKVRGQTILVVMCTE